MSRLYWSNLPDGEEAARRNQHLVQLVHYRGFADAGITGDEHEFGGALGHDPVERRKQRIDLALPPVQLLRDQQSVRRVVRAQREWIDATMRLPFRQAPPKIGFQARGGLVALLGVLGEELHDDGGQRLGDCGAIAGRYRLTCDVAVDPLQRVGGSKRQHARKHLVQGDAQRVEIAAGIDRAIHAPGLFGRHVGEGAGNDLRRRGRLALARQPGRDAEAGEPDVAGVVDEHVRRLDVLVDETAPMDVAERRRQANGDAQEARQIERLPLVPLKNAIQGLTARVLEYEDRPSFVTSERQRLGCPRGIEFGCERVFVLEPSETLRRRLFCGECDRQDRRWVAVLPAAVKGEVRTFPDGLQHVPRRLCHGGHPCRHGCTIPKIVILTVFVPSWI